VRPQRVWGARKKKFPKTNPTWAEEMEKKGKKQVNLSSPPWLAQGQGETKKVDPSGILESLRFCF